MYWLKKHNSKNCCVLLMWQNLPKLKMMFQLRAQRDMFDSMHLLVQSSFDSHPGLHWHFWSVQIPSILQSIFVLHMNSKNIQIFKLCKAISNETDFFVYQSNLQSYPNWHCIGRFQIHHNIHFYDSLLQLHKNRLKERRPIFIILPFIFHFVEKNTFAVTLKAILF